MKLDLSINGHKPNCICRKCGEGRRFIQVLRGNKHE